MTRKDCMKICKVIRSKKLPCCHQRPLRSISSREIFLTSFLTSFKYLAPFMLTFLVTGSLSIQTGGSTFPSTIITKQNTFVAPCFLMLAIMKGFCAAYVPTFRLLWGCSRRKYFSSPNMMIWGKSGYKAHIPSNQIENSSLASMSRCSNF